MPDEIIVTLETNEVDVSVDDRITITFDHSKLNNLDYEHSGHTGFASTEHLNLLVPKRLSVMPTLNPLSNRQNAYLYVDDNGDSTKVSIKDMLGYLIRRGEDIPEDMQAGEYLLLEIKED